jgi:hypothetical protein
MYNNQYMNPYTNAVQLKLCLESVDYDLDYVMCNQPEI